MKTHQKIKYNVILSLSLLLFMLFAIGGCATQQTPTIPASITQVGITYFTQPQTSSDMLAGYMPEESKHIDTAVFPLLDSQYEDILISSTKREYTSSSKALACTNNNPREQGTSALAYWITIGECMNVDVLIVPQVTVWDERAGSGLGVISPASVKMDFFLLDIKNKRLINRSHYNEEQKQLTDNLLDIGKFIERKGKWVNAQKLSQEAMLKSIKELGL